MSGDTNGLARARSNPSALALACALGWALAASSAGLLGVWAAMGGASVALGVVVSVLDREAIARMLRPSFLLVLLGAATGGAMALVTFFLYPLLARFAPFIATDTARLYAEFRAPSQIIAAIALVPVVLGEELVWRGVVQGALVRRLGPWGGVTVAAAALALALAPLGSPVLVAVALACGIAWGSLSASTASLVPAAVAHVVWDVSVLLLVPLDVAAR